LNIKSLSGSVDSGWIVSLANYSLQQRDVAKQIHAFLNPSVGVVAYGSQKIEVSVSDVDKFFVGSVIVVRNNDYSDITQELTVIDILGNEIEVDQVPSYAIQALDVIELIGFSNDNGSSYRLV
jgi:formyltetrahydrofolate synthetase